MVWIWTGLALAQLGSGEFNVVGVSDQGGAIGFVVIDQGVEQWAVDEELLDATELHFEGGGELAEARTWLASAELRFDHPAQPDWEPWEGAAEGSWLSDGECALQADAEGLSWIAAHPRACEPPLHLEAGLPVPEHGLAWTGGF